MVEIQTEIWDYLYKNGPTSLNALAGALGRSLQTIEAAVNHEWFTMQGDVASIAVHETGHVESRGEQQAKPGQDSSQILRDMFSSGG